MEKRIVNDSNENCANLSKPAVFLFVSNGKFSSCVKARVREQRIQPEVSRRNLSEDFSMISLMIFK